MNDAALRVEGLEFQIKKKKLLNGIEFSIRQGSVFSIVGHNGAGKTTLFHLILGLKIQNAGQIRILGKSNLDFNSRRAIGYVTERPYLNLDSTLRAFLKFHAALIDVPRARVLPEIERVASEVGLKDNLDKKLSTFSKGMLQKSLIAQAKLGNPEIFILDEPMSGLDPESRDLVRSQIIRLKEEGKTIIFSSHALEDVEVLSDHVLILKEGVMQFLGSVDEWRVKR